MSERERKGRREKERAREEEAGNRSDSMTLGNSQHFKSRDGCIFSPTEHNAKSHQRDLERPKEVFFYSRKTRLRGRQRGMLPGY